MFPLQKSVKPAVIFLKMSTRPLPMIGVLLASDLLALAGAGVISVYLAISHEWPVCSVPVLATVAGSGTVFAGLRSGRAIPRSRH